MRGKGAHGVTWRNLLVLLVWSVAASALCGALALVGTPYGAAVAASLGSTAAIACLGAAAAWIVRRRQPYPPAPDAPSLPVLERFDDLRERVRSTLGALNNSLGRIAKATQATQDIAARTNLLALDSMIATARFAQAGKDFAPAAAAARSIAGETRHSMAEIGSHIREINDLAASVSATVDEVDTVVSDMQGMVNGIVPDRGKIVHLADWPGRRVAPAAATEPSPP